MSLVPNEGQKSMFPLIYELRKEVERLQKENDELRQQLKNCNLQNVVNKVAVCSLKNLPCDYQITACKKKKTDCICRKVMQTET